MATLMTKRLAPLLLIILTVSLQGCGTATERAHTPSETPQTAKEQALPPTWAELAEASYQGIFDHPVALSGGRWEGDPHVAGGASRPSVGLVEKFSLSGDLDADGDGETAVLLWENSGGSGTRLYLAVTERTEEGVVNTGTMLIGDRVQIRSGAIEDGHIVLEVVRQGGDDAACCPTHWASMSYLMNSAGLQQSSVEDFGILSLADLEGPKWILVELGRDHKVAAGSNITLAVQGDRVTGTAGCNSYFGGIQETGPGGINIGDVGATMMACPEGVMETEQKYLAALSGAVAYRFFPNRLAVTCEGDEELVTLLFEQRP